MGGFELDAAKFEIDLKTVSAYIREINIAGVSEVSFL